MKSILTGMNKMFKIMMKQSLKQRNQDKVFLCTKSVNNNAYNDVRTYSLEETATILKVLNEETPEGLRNYKISKAHALMLKENRDKNGEYKSLNEPALLQIINYNDLNDFCTSVITGKVQESKLRQKKKYPIIPQLNEQKRKKINSVLGIHIGTNVISWAALNYKSKVLDWSCASFLDVKPGDSLALLETVLKLNSKLLTYDVFVMEETKLSNFNVTIPLLLQKQQLIAMILTCIALKNKNNGTLFTDNVFFLRNKLIPQRYKLLVGSEIISTTEVVNKMLDSSVSIDESIKAMYLHKSNEQQEQMRWSLLLSVCFLELAVRREHIDQKDT